MKWKAILPSLAVVGEPFRLAIVAEDMWGNPTANANQPQLVAHGGAGTAGALSSRPVTARA